MSNNLSIDEKAMLKFKLLVNGIKVTDNVLDELREKEYRIPKITRSGASCGIEAVIEGDLFVNIPLSQDSSYSLSDDCRHIIVKNGNEVSVKILGQPAYYDKKIGGQRMEQFGRVCFDRLGITLTSDCYFKNKGLDADFVAFIVLTTVHQSV